MLVRAARELYRWEESKGFIEDEERIAREKRAHTEATRQMEEAFAKEDLQIKKRGGRVNKKADAAREAAREEQRAAARERLSALIEEEESMEHKKKVIDVAFRQPKAALKWLTKQSLARDNVLKRMVSLFTLKLGRTDAVAQKDSSGEGVHTLEARIVSVADAVKLGEIDKLAAHRRVQADARQFLLGVAMHARQCQREELDQGRNEQLIQHRQLTYDAMLGLEALGRRAIHAALRHEEATRYLLSTGEVAHIAAEQCAPVTILKTVAKLNDRERYMIRMVGEPSWSGHEEGWSPSVPPSSLTIHIIAQAITGSVGPAADDSLLPDVSYWQWLGGKLETPAKPYSALIRTQLYLDSSCGFDLLDREALRTYCETKVLEQLRVVDPPPALERRPYVPKPRGYVNRNPSLIVTVPPGTVLFSGGRRIEGSYYMVTIATAAAQDSDRDLTVTDPVQLVVSAVPVTSNARRSIGTGIDGPGFAESLVPVPDERIDFKTHDELMAFVSEKIIPYIGVESEATSSVASRLRQARASAASYTSQESGDAARLVLREPVAGGRTLFTGSRKIDNHYFLVQVLTVAAPPTPRNPGVKRVSLVVSARDPIRNTQIERELPAGDVPPLLTLHALSDYVRGEVLPKLHIVETFTEGKHHDLSVDQARSPTRSPRRSKYG